MNRFHCAKCGKRLKFPDEHAGKNAHCPRCNHSFQLPALKDPMDSAEAAVLNEFEVTAPRTSATVARTALDQRYLERLKRLILLNPASQVEIIAEREKFENRLTFHRAKIAAGHFQDLSVFALENLDPGDAQPFLIVITGSYQEHVRFENYPDASTILERCFPGETWDVVAAVGGYYNFSLPNSPLASTKSFDEVASRLKPGTYFVREVLLSTE